MILLLEILEQVHAIVQTFVCQGWGLIVGHKKVHAGILTNDWNLSGEVCLQILASAPYYPPDDRCVEIYLSGSQLPSENHKLHM